MSVYFVRDCQIGRNGAGDSRPWCWRVHSTSTGQLLGRVELLSIRWGR